MGDGDDGEVEVEVEVTVSGDGCGMKESGVRDKGQGRDRTGVAPPGHEAQCLVLPPPSLCLPIILYLVQEVISDSDGSRASHLGQNRRDSAEQYPRLPWDASRGSISSPRYAVSE